MLLWLLIPVGVLVIVYSKKIVDLTGTIPFAEKIFMNGGTYTFIKLCGLAIIILSFMSITGGLQSFLKNFFGPLFGAT